MSRREAQAPPHTGVALGTFSRLHTAGKSAWVFIRPPGGRWIDQLIQGVVADDQAVFIDDGIIIRRSVGRSHVQNEKWGQREMVGQKRSGSSGGWLENHPDPFT